MIHQQYNQKKQQNRRKEKFRADNKFETVFVPVHLMNVVARYIEVLHTARANIDFQSVRRE